MIRTYKIYILSDPQPQLSRNIRCKYGFPIGQAQDILVTTNISASSRAPTQMTLFLVRNRLASFLTARRFFTVRECLWEPFPRRQLEFCGHTLESPTDIGSPPTVGHRPLDRHRWTDSVLSRHNRSAESVQPTVCGLPDGKHVILHRCYPLISGLGETRRRSSGSWRQLPMSLSRPSRS